MQELEANWSRVAAIWWLIAWRTLLGGLVLGLAVGFLIGVVGALAGVEARIMAGGASVVGWLLGLGWALVVVRMALRKRYGDFRLALVPRP